MTDVVRSELEQPLAYESVNANRLALIKDKATRGYNAVTPSDSELAGFLELAHKYDLDPFADEIWISKSKPRQGRDGDTRDGQLLIMVGRNGLRKIARKSGLELAADVVHQNDTFRVVRAADRTLKVEHEYGKPEDRGDIVGAWAECYDPETDKTKGFNYAPLSEYMPSNENAVKFGPWGSTPSIMITTAAERNALRQAVPLGGLIAESDQAVVEGDVSAGETVDVDAALAEVVMDLDAPLRLREDLLTAIRHVNLQSPQAFGLAKAQMTLPGRSEAELQKELMFLIQTFSIPVTVFGEQEPEEEHIPDAQVVEDPGASKTL